MNPITNQSKKAFLGATKHLYNWLCPSVGWSVTHSFDEPHIAPIGLLGLVFLSETSDESAAVKQ